MEHTFKHKTIYIAPRHGVVSDASGRGRASDRTRGIDSRRGQLVVAAL